VLRALEKDPDKRYATAQDMQRDIEAFAREHKLAMSPISVAALMDTLFDRRIDGWVRAHRDASAVSEELPDIVVATTDPADEAMATSIRQPVLAPRAPKMRRAGDAWWLVAALLAAAIAGGAMIEEVATAPAEPDQAVFDPDARAISAALETAVHTAQLRVDGLASAPMLRAAIETDAATIADLAHDEKLIAPAQREVMEIFQKRDGQTASVLRIPRDAAAITVRGERDARVETDGTELFVIVATPIAGSHTQIGGTLAMSVPLDLAPIQRMLDGRVETAAIAGLGPEVRLVGPRRPLLGAALRVPIPPAGDSTPSLALVVGTKPTGGDARSAVSLPYVSLALALAALAGFVFARIRARESAHA
jgi:hypothetical protein